MDTHLGHVRRGRTFHWGQTPPSNYGTAQGIEGLVTKFPNVDPTNETLRRDGGEVTAMLVRNVSTVALLPGQACVWASGYRNRRVDGYSRQTAEEIAGFVDDHLPASGVPVNDLFWLIIDGQVLGNTPLDGSDFGGDIAVGDLLYALTAAASTGVTAGRLKRWGGTFSATETTDGTAGRILTNYAARALSAKTTAQTGQKILMDVQLR